MNIGRSLAIACAIKGINQTEAAESAGLVQPQLSKICKRNSCQTATLEKLAEAFDCTVSEFIALGEAPGVMGANHG